MRSRDALDTLPADDQQLPLNGLTLDCGRLAYAVAPVLVSLLVFEVLYAVVAHAVLTWREVLPGALLAALAFEVLKVGFALYATHLGGASVTYGAAGVLVAVVALPHFGAQIALFGAVFARVYRELRREPRVVVGAASRAAG